MSNSSRKTHGRHALLIPLRDATELFAAPSWHTLDSDLLQVREWTLEQGEQVFAIDESDFQAFIIWGPSGPAREYAQKIKQSHPFAPVICLLDSHIDSPPTTEARESFNACLDIRTGFWSPDWLAGHLEEARQNCVNEQARETAELTLQNAAREPATTAAETFVRMITDHLAKTLQVEVAMVGRICESSMKSLRSLSHRSQALRTTAVSVKGYSSLNVEIPLENSPLEKVVERGDDVFYGENLGQRFPKDLYIKGLNAESFLGVPLRDSRRNIIGIIAIFDISPMQNRRLIESTIHIFASRIANEIERGQVAEELKAQASILQQINEGVVTADLNGMITNWNPQADALFGITHQEAVGTSLSNLLPDKDRSTLRQKLIAPVLIDGHHQTEIEFRHKTDRPIYCLVNISIQRSGRGSIMGIIICCTDITAHKASEARERESQQRLAFHIDRAPLAFIEWDRDFKITAWNPAAERLFGYSKEEVIGSDCSKINDDGNKNPAFVASAERLEHVRNRIKHVTENITKLGRRITCEWLNTPLINEKQEIVGFASLIQDITTRIESEKALLEAKEAAEGANRLKNEFLSVMSHEIRTPLNSIIGFGDLLMSIEEDPEKRDNLDVIRGSSRELLKIIESVLDYSKIEAGQINTEFSEMDLTAVVFEICEHYNRVADAKDLRLKFDLQDDIPALIEYSWDCIRTIINNLVDNAIKFTEEGEVNVSVKAEPCMDSDKWHYCIKISDTGVGIDQKKIPKLFQLFGQVDGSSTRRFEGLGLGLATSKKLAERISATIVGESQVDKGSEFSILFDALPVVDEPEEPAKPSEEEETKLIAEKYPLRILLVEDDPSTQFMFVRLLKKFGYDPAVAGDGAEAVELVHSNAYDLIFMDVFMPRMDGYEATEAIRTGQHRTDGERVFICAITADIHCASEENCLSVGMDACLKKPIFAGNTIEVIEACFAHHGYQAVNKS
ncbi:MAG: PAS domain S-box protein [Opitutales bacterium]